MNNLLPYNFYFELPIYTRINLGSTDEDFRNLLGYNGGVDAYNPILKENTTYSITCCKVNNADYFRMYGGMEVVELKCVRTRSSVHVFIHYNKKEEVFQKIGQFPSIADFHISQVKKYDKVLATEKLKEFTRAIGLAANGVGIGSFVYLRRIFEGLIEDAHILAKSSQAWNDDQYVRSRMSDKIELLKDYLPEFLVENKSLYGILSIGIHELNESDCLAYFETVRVGIELILDEKLDLYKKKKKIEDAKKKIASLTGKIQQNKSGD
jgi:hypothetical protein